MLTRMIVNVWDFAGYPERNQSRHTTHDSGPDEKFPINFKLKIEGEGRVKWKNYIFINTTRDKKSCKPIMSQNAKNMRKTMRL